MSSPDDPPKRGWRSIRFTLGELFLLLAGLALGLAYARVDGSDRWHDFLLAIFGGCFVVGMVQKSWRTWSLRRGDPTITFVDVTWPLAVAVLMVFTGVMQAAARHNWWAFQDSDGDVSWGTGDFNDSAFYLAVICGYVQRRETPPRHGWRRWAARIVDAVVILLGAYWLLFVLMDGMLIVSLVHTAIQGVELAEPTRWGGKFFYPAKLHTELTQHFITRAYLTAALLAGAIGANIALARTWPRGWVQRILWSVVCLLCLLGAMRLDWWCLRIAFPTLSPFIYSVLDTLPPGNLLVAVAIVTAGTAAFSMRVCAVPRPGPSVPPHAGGLAPLCLHEWIFVPTLCLLAASWKGIESVSSPYGWPFGSISWWRVPIDLLYAAVEMPRWIIWLALLIVVGERIWHWCRGRQPTDGQWSVPSARFAVVWFFALLTGLLMIPAASWLGFALYLRWGGP